MLGKPVVSDARFVVGDTAHQVGLGSDWDDPPIGQAIDVGADPEPDWRWMLTLATVPRPDHRTNPARACERKLGVDGWWWTGPKPAVEGQGSLFLSVGS